MALRDAPGASARPGSFGGGSSASSSGRSRSSSSSTSSSSISGSGSSPEVSPAARAGHAGASSSSSSSSSQGSSISVVCARQAARKRKVARACIYCQRSHMTCDEARPCHRCVKRGIAHLCHDSDGKGFRFSESVNNNQSTDNAATESGHMSASLKRHLSNSFHTESELMGMHNTLPLPIPVTPLAFASEEMGNEFAVLSDFLASFAPQQAAAAAAAVVATTSSGSGSAPASVSAGGAHTSCNMDTAENDADSHAHGHSRRQPIILDTSTASPPSSGGISPTAIQGAEDTARMMSMYNGDAVIARPPRTDGLVSKRTPPVHALLHSQEKSSMSPEDEQHHLIRSGTEPAEKFLLAVADPTGDISFEDRLGHIIRAKYECGLLRPYNYVSGYVRLFNYLHTHVAEACRTRIIKVLATFPSMLKAAYQNLTDIDLVHVEEAFERLLLDYDRVFSSVGIPACLWRRTGEICRSNKEFANLIHASPAALRTGELCIYQFMSDESMVNYWERLGTVAFDNGQKAVLTSCILRSLDGSYQLPCCFSFTVRRDTHGVPYCIVGNFLPILK